MILIATSKEFSLFKDTEEEGRFDTGNPNYTSIWLDTWFRVYKNNDQLVDSFRSVEDAKKALAKHGGGK